MTYTYTYIYRAMMSEWLCVAVLQVWTAVTAWRTETLREQKVATRRANRTAGAMQLRVLFFGT